ncbi:hypothetical protein MTR_6g014795 [Medicago truncatula]|uniref:Uncharacterized protein n=1 Tax=Medicago truncatula TaxID=3880 RepID=A0A072UGW7_MEDTR|nr:hypothetical protein MTR_6g014795 [Medicago truncatula]
MSSTKSIWVSHDLKGPESILSPSRAIFIQIQRFLSNHHHRTNSSAIQAQLRHRLATNPGAITEITVRRRGKENEED